MSNEKPILFTSAMVNAILSGRKTQTRRIVKHPEYFGCLTGDCPHDYQGACDEVIEQWVKDKSPFKAGMNLWVKETFQTLYQPDASKCNKWDESTFPRTGYKVIYRATDEKPNNAPWKPSIFMRRIFSRITLKIESVRVERLRDIADDDAIAEGMESYESNENMRYPHEQFMVLWNKINGKTHDWKSNPWLWVISFSVTKQKVMI